MTRLAAIALCFAALGCTTTEPWHGYSEREWYPDLDDPVRLSSLVGGWELVKGYGDTVGAPSEAFRVLFAVHRGRREVRLVRDFKDLEGLVRIRTAAQALEYVRLVHRSDTFFLFWEKRHPGHDYLGDRSDSEVHPFLACSTEVTEQKGERNWGSIPSATYRGLGLHRPIVRRLGNGFVVLRCLAWEPEASRDNASVYWVEEHVRTDGTYRLVHTTVAGTGLDIWFPGVWI